MPDCAATAARQFTLRGPSAILRDPGDVAQLGERRVRNAEVGSSILLVSTTPISLCRAGRLHGGGMGKIEPARVRYGGAAVERNVSPPLMPRRSASPVLRSQVIT